MAQVLSTGQLQKNANHDIQQWELVEFDNKPIQAWNEVNQKLMIALVSHQPSASFALKSLSNGETLFIEQLPLTLLDLNKPDENWLTALGFHPAAPKVPAIIGHISIDAPANNSALQIGDQIIEIDGVAIQNWSQLVHTVQDRPNQTVLVKYLRQDIEFSEKITLGSIVNGDKTLGRIGLGLLVDQQTMAPFSNTIQYGFVDAISQGWQRMQDLTYLSLQMLKKMLFGEIGLQHLSGPITIAQMSGQAVQSGLINFLSLLGLLSLSIGILNLLPIPVLPAHLLPLAVA
ncbi:regulator of sigma E protease [uncultured Thiomicrorhabdus sp.]